MTVYKNHKDYVGFSDQNKNPRDYYAVSPSCLFFEVLPSDQALYTMNDWDVSDDTKDLISARRIYMACDTEYEAATKLVGSWQAWLKLCKNKIFMNGHPSMQWGGLDEWRKERNERDTAVAKVQLMKSAKSGNVSAQRALYDGKKIPRKDTATTKKDTSQDHILLQAQERLKLIKK